ncbi:putative E3 ubiquitin-protein ligase LUL3 [Bienertia sinuspersici]
MGISFSGRRNQNHHHHPPYYHHSPLQQPYYYHPTSTTSTSTAVVEPSPLSLPPPPPPPAENGYVHSFSAYPTTNYQYQHTPSVQSNYYYPNWSNSYNYPNPNPMMGRPNFPYYPTNYGDGWHQMRPPLPQSQIPPPYVEHQSAKVVKNDVNVHKDTIKLQVDEDYPDQFLVSFVFDAHYDGRLVLFVVVFALYCFTMLTFIQF